MTLSRIFKVVEKFLSDNSPALLTAVGATGTITTAFLTGKASFKAAEVIRLEHDVDPNVTWQEDVKSVWRLYIPAIGTGIFTIASVIAANRIGTRRAAAMAAAYSLSERAFTEYREKIAERIGERREIQVRDEIAQDRVNRNPLANREVVLGSGSVLCYDSITGRYFQSDMETLRRAQNDINHQLLHDMYATLDDFYRIIGLASTKFSSEVGWTADNMLDLRFSATLSDNSQPCISIDYSSYPVRDYY